MISCIINEKDLELYVDKYQLSCRLVIMDATRFLTEATYRLHIVEARKKFSRLVGSRMACKFQDFET